MNPSLLLQEWAACSTSFDDGQVSEERGMVVWGAFVWRLARPLMALDATFGKVRFGWSGWAAVPARRMRAVFDAR